MKTLLQKEYAVISYYPQRELMVLHLIQKVSAKTYQDSFKQLARLAHEHPHQHLIVDQRYVEELHIDYTAWLISEWFPKFSKKLPRNYQVAFISQLSLFEQLGSEFVAQSLQELSGLRVKSFSSLEEGRAWLEESSPVAP